MSQIVEGALSKRTRRRGKWKQNWIRKNGGNLAKKQKLLENAVEDVKSAPTIVGLVAKPYVDKAVLIQPKRKYSNPVHLWRKTYENLLKWQTTHQLNYWKNNSRNLYRENMKLKDEMSVLTAQLDAKIVEPNKTTDIGPEVIDLEDEETPPESSSDGENDEVEPTDQPDEKHAKFLQFLKATAAYNRKK